MNRLDLEKYITNNYPMEANNPWAKHPNFRIFRHSDNKKWFALFMTLEKAKLSIKEEGYLDVVNLKCEPILIASLLREKGFHPAYHMNKTNWITLVLDGSIDEEKIKFLLDMSFESTKSKIRKKGM